MNGLLHKSHSPKEDNMKWNVSAAMLELKNFPSNENINWSTMAQKYDIPQKNAWQVLKETAVKHGIDTCHLEQKYNTMPRIRKHKCRLPGGEISVPCLPTVTSIKEEKNS